MSLNPLLLASQGLLTPLSALALATLGFVSPNQARALELVQLEFLQPTWLQLHVWDQLPEAELRRQVLQLQVLSESAELHALPRVHPLLSASVELPQLQLHVDMPSIRVAELRRPSIEIL